MKRVRRHPAKKKPPPVEWSWDVEASDPERPWDGVTLVIAKSERGDREVFQGRDCLLKMAEHCERARGIYTGLYSGGYDTPLLMNYWKPRRVLLSGSIILCADGGAGLAFWDAFPWWLASAAKVGKAVGVEKIDVDRALMERLSMEELIPYCERDVDIVSEGRRVCQNFLAEYGVDPRKHRTAGSSAAALVKALEPGTWNAMKRHRCDVDDVVTFLQSGAARGGHVACNARGVVENVRCYDIKSSYPARYADRDMGVGLRRATAAELADVENFRGMARARWRWEDRTRPPPSLDQRTQCGVGDCEAWLGDDEIRCFLDCGVKPELVEGWCFVDVLPIAQAFARMMFAAKESGGAYSFFAKVFVNAFTGKTGMSALQEQFTSWHPTSWHKSGGDPQAIPEGPRGGWLWRYMTLAHDENNLCKPYQQPLISALTFSRARADLWRINDALYQAGWPVLYNDTDSVHTPCPRERMPVPLGEGLGQLAFDGGPYTGYYLGPKAYCLVDDAGAVQKCALKGVPHKSLADGVAGEVFREARGDERVKGRSWYARKGSGRDVRVELFKRALNVGAAKCLKDGLSTFLRGVKGTDEEGPGVWKRAPVERTVRPSGRGKVFLGVQTFEYLAPVEVSVGKMLAQLPDVERRCKQRFAPALRLALARELVALDARAEALPRLPRERYERRDGSFGARSDLWAAYSELVRAANAEEHDYAELDARYRESLKGRAIAPPPSSRGELDGLARDCLFRPSCPYEAFARLARGMKTWRQLIPVVEALRTYPPFHALWLDLDLVTPSKNVVVLTPRGEAWLQAMGPIWFPSDDDEDDDEADHLDDDPPF